MENVSPKWINKYMKLAKMLAEDNRSCLSRKIGSVLVTAENGACALGWNGSIRKGPANDSVERLDHIFTELMTDNDRDVVFKKYGIATSLQFTAKFADCGQCPRRLLNLKSGDGLHFCNCAHSERNCLNNSNRSGLRTIGATMFCYCHLPCHECAIGICQAGLKRVVCLKNPGPDYSPSSRHLFEEASVEVYEVVESDDLVNKFHLVAHSENCFK